MKKIACVVFEVAEDEMVENVISQIQTSLGRPKCEFVESYYCFEEVWKDKLKNILNRLSVVADRKGYFQLFYVMEAIAKNPDMKNNLLIRKVYGEVTNKTGATYQQLYRNIRSLIDRIYRTNTSDYIKEVLKLKGEHSKPLENKEFIAVLAELIF